jgi:hypothetical protein
MVGGAHEDARPWTASETRELIQLQSVNGNSWGAYAFHFKRSPSSVRNKYQRITKASSLTCKNKCKMCGKPRRGHVCYKEIEQLCNDIPEDFYRTNFKHTIIEEEDMQLDVDDITELWKCEGTLPHIVNVRLVLSGCQTSVCAILEARSLSASGQT